jgi:hypothetical protein
MRELIVCNTNMATVQHCVAAEHQIEMCCSLQVDPEEYKELQTQMKGGSSSSPKPIASGR